MKYVILSDTVDFIKDFEVIKCLVDTKKFHQLLTSSLSLVDPVSYASGNISRQVSVHFFSRKINVD